MTKENKLKLVTEDDPQSGQPEKPNAPQNGEHWKIYPFEQRRALRDGDFETVPRNKRQRGKIAEAQRFRKAQGSYLSERAHFFDISQESSSHPAQVVVCRNPSGSDPPSPNDQLLFRRSADASRRIDREKLLLNTSSAQRPQTRGRPRFNRNRSDRQR